MRLEKSKLKKGDILLYSGSNIVDKIIKKLDKSDYNHASLYIGEGKVIEALAKFSEGVTIRTVEESIEKSEKVIVKRLANDVDLSMVINIANSYLDKRYGYAQIVLLAIILISRPHKYNNFFFKLVNKILEDASQFILLQTNGGKKAIICSELVYRAYDEVFPEINDPYTIYIKRSMYNNQKISVYNNNSLVSKFYGMNNYNKNTSSFIEKSNIDYIKERINIIDENQLSIENTWSDIKESFNGYQIKLINNDNSISDEEDKKLKTNLDRFLTAYYYSKNINLHEKILSKDILLFFIIDNANFVTPGDLQYAENLSLEFILKGE